MMISKHSRNIAISFVIVLGLSLLMIIFDLSRMKIMQSKLDSITKEHNVKSNLMRQIRDGVYERQVVLRDIMLMDDAFDRLAGQTIFNKHALNISLARTKFSMMSLNEEEKVLLENLTSNMRAAYYAQEELIDYSIYNADKPINKEEINKGFKIQQKFKENIYKMIHLQDMATKMAVIDAEISYAEAKSSVYILGGSILLFGVLVAIFIIRLTESQARNVEAAMNEIEKSRNLLEDRIYQRTKDLAKARDEALSSNKAKDDFIATMSHELRTPLNIILGYSELLAEEAKDEGYNSLVPDLNKIEHAARHQLELINDILDISKIEDGKIEISPIDFDIEKLLFEIEESVSPLMQKNNNNFVINCTNGIGMMYSDNLKIRQILLNLLSNAAKFTKNGFVTLNVSKDADGDEVFFEVQDDGVGIEKSYMDTLFDKFTQADSSTSRKYGGSGLGLSISKQLSIQLHGDISVNSEPKKGSLFMLKLPMIYV